MEGRRIEELKTIISDERYPWLPGKKPLTASEIAAASAPAPTFTGTCAS
jgi:hypothetical protein